MKPVEQVSLALDALFRDAVLFTVSRGEVSADMLQREFTIGPRTSKCLLDLFVKYEVIAPCDTSCASTVHRCILPEFQIDQRSGT